MNKLIVVLVLIIWSPTIVAQDLNFVIQNNLHKKIKLGQIQQAETLKDLNPSFPAEWIDSNAYVKVVLSSEQEEKVFQVTGPNDQLTPKQQALINQLNISDQLKILVKYNSINAATQIKELRNIEFTLTLVPEIEAQFKGGEENLNDYVQEEIIKKLEIHPQFDLASFSFNINEQGKIASVEMLQSSNNEIIDELILNQIRLMPNWNPAKNIAGENINQTFEILFGNLVGC